MKDIQNRQLLNIVFFGILILILIGVLTWHNTVETSKQQLLILAKTLSGSVIEQRQSFLPSEVDPLKIQAKLGPLFTKTLQLYPQGYTVGFYSRTRNQVLVLASNIPRFMIYHLQFPENDSSRLSWKTKKPQFQLHWSTLRRDWILTCNFPVVIDGRVIGHTFANVRLVAIGAFYLNIGLGFLTIIVLTGFISCIVSQWSIRKIRKNINQLALFDESAAVPFFDYDEFNRIAADNHRIFWELHVAEQFKSKLLQNFPWGYALFNANFSCIEINQRGADLIGIEPESVVGKDRSPILKLLSIEAEFEGQLGTNRELKIIRPDNGLERSIFCCCFPTPLHQGEEGFMVWFIDITERVHTQEALRKSALKVVNVEGQAKQLAALVESSDDAIFRIGLDGAITSWNQGAVKIYGYTPSEIIGRNNAILIPPELQRTFREIIRDIQDGKDVEAFETESIRRDGVKIYVSIKISVIKSENGEIIGASAIHRDITDKKRYEDSLRAERERLAVTLNSIDAGVISTDKYGKIVFLNKHASKLTGWDFAEAIKQPLPEVFNLIDDRSGEVYQGLVAQVLNSESPVQFYHALLIDRNLEPIPVSISCTQIKTAEKAFAGTVIIFQDVSDKLKTEAELLKAEKLESLGILAGGIAHDFNNILAAVVANLQLALLKYEKGQEIQKYIQETVEISQRASELTKQLLTFSKGGAPVKKAASLVELITDTTRFVLRGSKVKAIFAIDPELWPVEVDSGQISQVIHNLILNANQAMPVGGIIRIKADNVFIQPGGRFKPGSYVKLIIHDTGIGIPKDILHKIFDPFFTTKKEGNGLGLATAYSIIKKHDGYIEVESAEKGGTSFTILLPTAVKAEAIVAARAETSAASEGAKILLMDDEEIILKVVGEMMRYFGYHVTLARDGAEAIRYYQAAAELGEPFDAVVMDLTIPGGIGGPEAIVKLRQIDPGIRAIVSSGYSNDPIMSNYESYGFCGVVRKPYRFEELNQVLCSVIEKKQLKLDLLPR